MEPIDERITAAQLMALRSEPNAAFEICALLGVDAMPVLLADRSRNDIDEFIRTGDATRASQLIHTVIVWHRRKAESGVGSSRHRPKNRRKG